MAFTGCVQTHDLCVTSATLHQVSNRNRFGFPINVHKHASEQKFYSYGYQIFKTNSIRLQNYVYYSQTMIFTQVKIILYTNIDVIWNPESSHWTIKMESYCVIGTFVLPVYYCFLFRWKDPHPGWSCVILRDQVWRTDLDSVPDSP